MPTWLTIVIPVASFVLQLLVAAQYYGMMRQMATEHERRLVDLERCSVTKEFCDERTRRTDDRVDQLEGDRRLR